MAIESHIQSWFDLSYTEREWESLHSLWIENGESKSRIPEYP